MKHEERMAEILAEKLISFRNKYGLTQLDLSVKAAVCRSEIGHIERKRRLASISVLVKLAALLRISINELIGEPLPDNSFESECQFVFEEIREELKEKG